MRTYDETVEVRRGLVAGQEAPEQFVWRSRLWVVRDLVAHWVVTGSWWEQPGIADLLGDPSRLSADPSRLGADLLAEREVWRVEACRGRPPQLSGDDSSFGVFDLAFDWATASWLLVRCLD